jgi:membrane protein
MGTDQPDGAGVSGSDETGGRVTARVVTRVSRTRDRLDASRVGHVQRRFVQADLVNQAVILAALAFTLLVPVLVTIAALLPLAGADSLPAAVAGRLGLSAQATEDLQQLFPTRSEVRGSSTVLGTAFTLISAYTWPTALQRGYEIAWGVSSRGWKGLWRPLVWLTAFVAVGALLVELPSSPLLSQPWRTLLLLLLGMPVVFAWSWWTQYFLLRGAVGWRLLLPGAVAMTAGLLLLRVAAGFYVSAGISQNYAHYGPLGIVFMLLTWLVAFSVIMLGGPVLGAALHEHRLQSGAAGPDTTGPPSDDDAGQLPDVPRARAGTADDRSLSPGTRRGE